MFTINKREECSTEHVCRLLKHAKSLSVMDKQTDILTKKMDRRTGIYKDTHPTRQFEDQTDNTRNMLHNTKPETDKTTNNVIYTTNKKQRFER